MGPLLVDNVFGHKPATIGGAARITKFSLFKTNVNINDFNLSLIGRSDAVQVLNPIPNDVGVIYNHVPPTFKSTTNGRLLNGSNQVLINTVILFGTKQHFTNLVTVYDDGVRVTTLVLTRKR